MEYLYFIATALTSILIYRQGLKDGQKVSNGEKIIDKPIQLKSKADKQADKEQERIANAIKARMEYGVNK